MCFCLKGEHASIIWSLWTDSFQQEITAICVTVQRLIFIMQMRVVPTQGDVSIATRGIDLSVVLTIGLYLLSVQLAEGTSP